MLTQRDDELSDVLLSTFRYNGATPISARNDSAIFPAVFAKRYSTVAPGAAVKV